MKKYFIIIACMTALNGYTQTVGGNPGNVIDSSNNPSGQAFGGAMGGGMTNQPSRSSGIQSTTTPDTTDDENRNLGVPRGNEFPEQRMEDRTNYAGGALGGDTNVPSQQTIPPGTTTYPADTPVAPSVPPAGVDLPRVNGNTSPTGSGVGTGNP
jgi:hypothetical protein